MPKLSLAKLERHIYSAADRLRQEGLDAATYKDYIFGMLFLKRCSDVFDGEHENIVGRKIEQGMAKEAAVRRELRFLRRVLCSRACTVAEVQAKKSLFDVLGFDHTHVFAKRPHDCAYLDFAPTLTDRSAIRSLIESDAGVQARVQSLRQALVTWWHDNVPILTPKDMKAFKLSDTIEHVTNEAARMGSRLMPSETVFIVVRGMILAHTFPVCLCTRPFAFNQDIKAVRGKQGLDNRFLAHWFVGNSALFLRKATEATHGTKKLDLDELHRVHIGVPSPEEQQAIVEHIEALDSIASVETAELAKLGALKSGLMTDLLTGRVRVPEHFGMRRHDAALSSYDSGDTSPHSKEDAL